VIRETPYEDKLVEKALDSLCNIWKVDQSSKLFLQVEYGNLQLMLNQLKNMDEGVMYNACRAFKFLTSGKGAPVVEEMLIKHRGI